MSVAQLLAIRSVLVLALLLPWVAFAGGLMQPGAFLRKLVEHRLKSVVPGAVVRHEPVVPVRGAIRMARRAVA